MAAEDRARQHRPRRRDPCSPSAAANLSFRAQRGYTFGPPQWGHSGTGVLIATSGTIGPPQWGHSGTGVLTTTSGTIGPPQWGHSGTGVLIATSGLVP